MANQIVMVDERKTVTPLIFMRNDTFCGCDRKSLYLAYSLPSYTCYPLSKITAEEAPRMLDL